MFSEGEISAAFDHFENQNKIPIFLLGRNNILLQEYYCIGSLFESTSYHQLHSNDICLVFFILKHEINLNFGEISPHLDNFTEIVELAEFNWLKDIQILHNLFQSIYSGISANIVIRKPILQFSKFLTGHYNKAMGIIQNRNMEFNRANTSFDNAHQIFTSHNWIFESVKSRLTQLSLLLHSIKTESELERKFSELSGSFEKLSAQEETVILPMYLMVLEQSQRTHNITREVNIIKFNKGSPTEDYRFICNQFYDHVSNNELNRATELINDNYLLLHDIYGIAEFETQIKLLHTQYLYHYKLGELEMALNYIKQLKLLLREKNRKRELTIVDNYLFNIYGLRTTWRNPIDEFQISQIINAETSDDLETSVKLYSRLYRLRIYLNKTDDVGSIRDSFLSIEKEIDTILKCPSSLSSLFHLIKALYYRYIYELDTSEQSSLISISLLSESYHDFPEILYENYVNLAQIEFYKGNYKTMLELLNEAENISFLPWWQKMELYLRIILFMFLSDLNNNLITDYYKKMEEFYERIEYKTDICRYLFLISQAVFTHSKERFSDKFEAISIYQNCLSIGGIVEYDLIVSYLLICLYLEEYLISDEISVQLIKQDIFIVLEKMKTFIPNGNVIFEEFYNLASVKIYYFFKEEIKLKESLTSSEFIIDKFRKEVQLISNNNPYLRVNTSGTIKDLRQTFLQGVKTTISNMGIKEVESEGFFRDEYLKQLGLVTEGVSHDLKNIIFAIRLGIEQIQHQDLTIRNEIIETLLNISHTADRVFSFLHSGFSNPQEFTDLDIVKTIDEFVEFARNVKIGDFKLVYKNSISNPIQVKHEKGLFITVLFNLLFNSKKAMDAIDRPVIEIVVETDANNFILKFTDNGTGIPENKITEIFKYGFTLKESGHGIGLSNVKNIIEFMNGSLLVESTFGEYTSFTILLPLLIVFER